MSNSIFPNTLIQKSKSLEGLGVSGVAWGLKDIYKVLDFCKENKIGILGGDVFKIRNDSIELLYENWYLNKSENAEFDEFVEESYLLAVEKVNLFSRSYPQKTLLFQLVICSR